jgi:hypothetical protein
MRKVYLEWDELWPWIHEAKRDDKYYDYVLEMSEEEYTEMEKVNEAFFVWQEKLKERCK